MSAHPQTDLAVSSDRLDSWKEIATYLGRSERTVRRWEEKEGLPVHRLVHEKRGSVFAYRTELDAWWEARKSSIETGVPAAEAAPSSRIWRSRIWQSWMTWVTSGLVIVGAAATTYNIHERALPPQEIAGIPAWYKGDPEAYRAYLRGAGFGASFSRARVRAAEAAYQEAVAINPTFAQAVGGLAATQIALTWFDDQAAARETMGRARQFTARLHELDPNSATYWRVESWVSEWVDQDYRTAEKFHQKSIELAPENATMMRTYAEFLMDMRRFNEAVVWAKRAFNLSPSSPTVNQVYGTCFYFAGKTEQALQVLLQTVEAEPNAGLPRIFLARIYLDRGEFGRALEHLRKADDLLGQVPFSRGELGRALALAGERKEAQTILDQMTQRREAGYYPAFALAMVHMGLGNRDLALHLLERAVEERNTGYYSAYADPIYDPLRSEPRFKNLIREMKHPQ